MAARCMAAPVRSAATAPCAAPLRTSAAHRPRGSCVAHAQQPQPSGSQHHRHRASPSGSLRLPNARRPSRAAAAARRDHGCHTSSASRISARRQGVVARARNAGGPAAGAGADKPREVNIDELMSLAEDNLDDDIDVEEFEEVDDDDGLDEGDGLDDDDDEDVDDDDEDDLLPAIYSSDRAAAMMLAAEQTEFDDESESAWEEVDEDSLEDDEAADELDDEDEDLVEYDLAELLKAAGLADVTEALTTMDGMAVGGIAHDSRKVQDGDLFVCVPGLQVDGHDYAEAAVANGAVALVVTEQGVALHGLDVEAMSDAGVCVLAVPDTHAALVHLSRAFYGDPSKELKVVGITGTNGKTTTSWLVWNMLQELDHSAGVIGTIQYAADEVKLTPEGDEWVAEEEDPTRFETGSGGGNLWPYRGRYDVPNTTPDALQLQQLFAGMVAQDCTAVAMEVSSHALDLGRTDGTDFDIAVFTNLSRDHLDFHGTWEAYRAAKLKLFEGLDDPSRQRAVINLDDPEAEHFIKAASKVPIVTYSMDNPDAAVYAETAELSLFETAVAISTPEGEMNVVSALLGRPNVYNMLAAAAVGVAMEAPLESIATGLEACEAVPGRFEMIDEGQPFAVIVDYAHTPDALERLLESVRETGARRILLVMGAGGDRDRGKRPMMGRIAHELADIVFVVNDNPRTEPLNQIVADIVSGFPIEVHNSNPGTHFNWLQDMWHTRHTREWTEMMETLKCQNSVRRYILEERFYAIRVAIAMADEGDAVVIAGKGHEDYVDWKVNWVDRTKHWFDDRQEARDTLQRVVSLQESGIDTRNLPWTQVDKN